MVDPGRAGGTPRQTWTIVGLALLSLCVHVAVNALGGYGYLRDELYYIACSRHLAAGNVDQPPLSIFRLAAARRLIGDSVFAIRLVPAILSGVSVALIGLLARRMGVGARPSCWRSWPPRDVVPTRYFSMNSLDIMFWLLAVHALLGAAERGGLPAWLWLGLVLGLGLLNKTSVLWLGAGVAAAIVLTGHCAASSRPSDLRGGRARARRVLPFRNLERVARLGPPGVHAECC